MGTTHRAQSVAPAVTQERMKGMSPSLAASSVTLLVAVLVLGTTSVKADFLDKNFLDNLFSFSGSQSPDYPSYDDVQQYPQYDGTDKQEDADAEEVKKPVKDVGGGRHVKGGVLPAYCDPPNPCPKGYTAEDGCIEVEEFENRAEFSRKYQASQNCMCDSEHMFSCPDVNSFDSMYKNQQDPGLFGLDAIAPLEDISNPYLSGSKLPIAAKKGMGY